jgi:hypothetical protein
MVLAELLDRFPVRVLLAFTVGVPVTVVALVFGFLGLVTGLGGLTTGTAKLQFLGNTLATILGLLGIAGAWFRLLAPHTAFGPNRRRVVVVLLCSGIASALLIAAYAVSLGATLAAGGALAVAALGLAFVAATPSVGTSTAANRNA